MVRAELFQVMMPWGCGPWCPSLTRKQKHPRPKLSFPVFIGQSSGRVAYGNIVTMARRVAYSNIVTMTGESGGEYSRITGWLKEGGH